MTKQNKYKVEFIETQNYVVDVLAKNEEEAKKKAKKVWQKIRTDGIEYYYSTGENEVETGTVYDVTNTDDPFNP